MLICQEERSISGRRGRPAPSSPPQTAASAASGADDRFRDAPSREKPQGVAAPGEAAHRARVLLTRADGMKASNLRAPLLAVLLVLAMALVMLAERASAADRRAGAPSSVPSSRRFVPNSIVDTPNRCPTGQTYFNGGCRTLM